MQIFGFQYNDCNFSILNRFWYLRLYLRDKKNQVCFIIVIEKRNNSNCTKFCVYKFCDILTVLPVFSILLLHRPTTHRVPVISLICIFAKTNFCDLPNSIMCLPLLLGSTAGTRKLHIDNYIFCVLLLTQILIVLQYMQLTRKHIYILTQK